MVGLLGQCGGSAEIDGLALCRKLGHELVMHEIDNLVGSNLLTSHASVSWAALVVVDVGLDSDGKLRETILV